MCEERGDDLRRHVNICLLLLLTPMPFSTPEKQPSIHRRKRDAKKKLAEEKAKRVAKEAEELKKLIKKNMIKDAVQTDEKWMHQELHSQDKSLKTRNLAAR